MFMYVHGYIKVTVLFGFVSVFLRHFPCDVVGLNDAHVVVEGFEGEAGPVLDFADAVAVAEHAGDAVEAFVVRVFHDARDNVVSGFVAVWPYPIIVFSDPLPVFLVSSPT